MIEQFCDYQMKCKEDNDNTWTCTAHLAYKDKMSNIEVYPSDVKKGKFDKKKRDFTHIVWFNR